MRAWSGFYADQDGPRWMVSEPAPESLDRARIGIVNMNESLELVHVRTCEEAGFAIGTSRIGLIAIRFPETVAYNLQDEHSYDFDDALRAVSARLAVLNSYAACLASAHYTVENLATGTIAVTAENLLHLTIDDAGHVHSVSGPHSGRLNLPGTSTYATSLRVGVVGRDVLDRAADLLFDVLACGVAGAVEVVSLLNDAQVAHERHNFALSTVCAWSICERLQIEEYIQHIGPAATHAAARKKVKALKAWEVTKKLAAINRLDATLESDLNRARQARNEWLHEGTAPTWTQSADSLSAASSMIRLVLGIGIETTQRTGVHM